MGKVSISGTGGAGVGSDECTATRADLLKGYTAVTGDSDDEATEGTLELTGDAADSQVLAGKTYYNINPKIKRTGSMVNQGAVSQVLNAGGSYTVPSGYHNGSGKVTANSLASQTPGNAGSGAILTGYNAWVNGNKVPGSIPIQGADVSGTDRAWATNISCWEGVACLGVRNAHYLNGVNWIQGNISNFYAGNIKKGVNMGGLVGTFEGYVPTATDLYLRGNNIRSWYGNGISFDSGQISILLTSDCHIFCKDLNFTGFTHLNIECYINGGTNKIMAVHSTSGDGNFRLVGSITVDAYTVGPYVFSFDVSSWQLTSMIRLRTTYMTGAIYRIWLS